LTPPTPPDRRDRVVDLQSGMTLLSLPDHATLIRDVAFHPDGTRFASAAGGYEGQGCMVRLWGRLPGMPWPPATR